MPYRYSLTYLVLLILSIVAFNAGANAAPASRVKQALPVDKFLTKIAKDDLRKYTTKHHHHHTSTKCSKDTDCSLNGVCSKEVCVCHSAWTGASCSSLNIIPGKKEYGYRKIDPPTNTSSWGGAVLYSPEDQKWYMWATELEGKCGMHTWTTNSQTIRASSDDPMGPYTREAVQFPVWSHEVDVTRGPNGEYVAFMSYRVPCPRPLCTTCTDGTTDPVCKKKSTTAAHLPRSTGKQEHKGMGRKFGDVGEGVVGRRMLISDTDATYMSWSNTPAGPWSTPQLVLMKAPEMDSNVAAVIHKDGTLVGMWRDHNPGGHHSTPHIFTASDWKDNTTYRWSDDELFSSKDVKGGIEDMFLWIDGRGNYHALFHMMYDCDNCGGHAYSQDGLKWKWTGQAYGPKVIYDDGTTFTFPYVERPHLVFDKTGTKPVALTNGVKTGITNGLSNDDQSFTLLRPLKQ